MKQRRIFLLVLLLSLLLTVNCFQEARPKPYFEQLEKKIAANEAPDVGFVDELRLPYYASNGYAQPVLAELVDTDFYPQLLRRFQSLDAKGNLVTYALPQSFTTTALMVNVTAFEKSGVKIPQSWNPIEQGGGELVDAAQKLQDEQRTAGNTDFYALGLTPELANWLPFFFQAGGQLYAQPGTLGVDSEPGRVALNLWVDLVKRGLVDTSAVTLEGWPYNVQDRLLGQFSQGKIGMMLVGASHFETVLGAKPGFEVQVVELPTGPVGKATVGYVRGYALYRPKPTADATALLQSLTAPQAMQETWMGHPMYMPPRPSLRSAWESKYPEHKAFMAGVDYVAPLNLPPVAWQDLENFDRATADVLYSAMEGKITVPDALAQIDELAAKYLK
jgi:multiple sugar transport system substrate-binding protein